MSLALNHGMPLVSREKQNPGTKAWQWENTAVPMGIYQASAVRCAVAKQPCALGNQIL